MLLLNKYFKIINESHEDDSALFHVSLLADCDVYRGHFPGNPVSPGVCNIEMIRECFCTLAGGNPRIKTIDRCRLTAVASPKISPTLDIAMKWTKDGDGWHVMAALKDENRQYMDFKATLN